MKGFEITAEMERSVLARREALHPFASLDPDRTAVIVIDMQIAYMDAERGFADFAGAHAIVPAINRLVAGARMAGAGVYWLKHTIPAADDPWTIRSELEAPAFRNRRAQVMSTGGSGHGIHESLDVCPQDTVLTKSQFSAFLPGSSELPAMLEANGIDTVLITGVATNVCCECSARDAIMRNYRTVMISDATSTSSAELQKASLSLFFHAIGDVYDVDMALNALALKSRS